MVFICRSKRVAGVVLLFGCLSACVVKPTPVAPTSTVTATATSPQPSPPSATPTATSVPQPSTSEDLIEVARQDGRIDYNTSLLYRAYAFAADSRLPAEYRGADPGIEDFRILADIAAARETLPPEMLEQLRPFLVRPNHPDSIFNKRLQAGNMPESGLRFASLAQQATATPKPSPCAGQWVSAVSVKYPVKVWACGEAATAQIAANSALVIIDSVWQPMTDLMGKPIPDTVSASDAGTTLLEDGNDDSKIDFYIVSRHTEVRRGTTPRTLGDSQGEMIPALPHIGRGSSGYVLLDNVLFGPNSRHDEKSIIVHEFFHVLEFAYNAKQFNLGSTCPAIWFYEASARWAETQFARELAPTGAYREFVMVFQYEDSSLYEESSIQHRYAAFIWPYFMQQQLGDAIDAQPIADAWEAMSTASTCNQGLDAIDSVLHFEEYFHLFALRNLNWDFEGDKPIAPLYSGLDFNFPSNQYSMPALAIDALLPPQDPAGKPEPYADKILSLRAHYYRFQPTDEVRQITFDFSQLQPAGDLDIDAVVKIKGKWKLLPPVTTGKLKFCRDDPTQDVSDIYLVMSNHNKSDSSLINGEMDVRALKESCAGTWSGTVTIKTEGNGASTQRDGTETEVVSSVAHLRVFNNTVNETRDYSDVDVMRGHVEVHAPQGCPHVQDTVRTVTTSASGSGTMDDLLVMPEPDGSYTIVFDLIKAVGIEVDDNVDQYTGGCDHVNESFHQTAPFKAGIAQYSVRGQRDPNKPNTLSGKIMLDGDLKGIRYGWIGGGPLKTTITWDLTSNP